MVKLKKFSKALLGRLGYTLGLHKYVLRDRAVVVAFHRISASSNGRALNCPPDVFAALCGFFKRHFSVMPLSELIAQIRQNRPIGNMLSITFDDGYKDNFLVAAPILRHHGLPATFFVATNYIGSGVIPEWDKRDGVESEWMSWEDVKNLQRMGFDIGGHTMNHANLALVTLDEAASEIAGCREMLEEILDSRVSNFAYPFGAQDCITPEARELVRRCGFDCCLSCHGGLVGPSDGLFDLPREPINDWVSSPYQYGYELLARASEAAK